MKHLIFIILFSLLLINCQKYPKGVKESLDLAKDNKKELIKVLEYFQEDSLKYKSACFLIDNMKWHYSTKSMVKIDTTILKYHHIVDSLYFDFIDTLSLQELLKKNINEFTRQNKDLKHEIDSLLIPNNTIPKTGFFLDLENIDSAFLVDHINHAFDMWKNSKFAQNLSYEDFNEYILPYRSLSGYHNFDNGKRIFSILGRFLYRDDILSPYEITNCLRRYTLSVGSPLKSFEDFNFNDGVYNFIINKQGDCIDLSNHGVNILRSLGIPSAIEYNLSHQFNSGRHFHCAFKDNSEDWNRINIFHMGLDSIPILSMNIFRNTFSAQMNSPYMIKNRKEAIPKEFMNPCIKEVSSEIYDVAQLELPIDIKTKNNLAYLYTFNKNNSGLLPGTWGLISDNKKTVEFENVLFNILYVGGIFVNDSLHFFTEPFYLTKKDSIGKDFQLNHLPTVNQTDKEDLLIHRKYPRKVSVDSNILMKFVDTRIEAANKEDFSDAETLLIIKEKPEPYFQEYDVLISKPFKYFRFNLNKQVSPYVIGKLELLIENNNENKKFPLATPLPVLHPDEINNFVENNYRRLKDTIVYNSQKDNKHWHWPYIDALRFDKPYEVKKIRFEPLNAKNNIEPGDNYRLMYWDKGWKLFEEQTSKYHFLEFKNVPKNKLYWINNLTKGQEELPFIYVDGKQLFIYHDIIEQ